MDGKRAWQRRLDNNWKVGLDSHQKISEISLEFEMQKFLKFPDFKERFFAKSITSQYFK